MRILQVFDFMSLPRGGGTVDIVYKLSKRLAEIGHDVTICTGDYDIDYNYLDGLEGVDLKLYHSYLNKFGVYLMPRLYDIDVCKYDVIHLHCFRSFQNIVLCKKATKQGVPYIVDAHGSTVHRNGSKTPLLKAYDYCVGKRLIKHASFVIAETEVGVTEWENLRADIRKIRVQHPLLDTSEFAVLPEKGVFRKRYRLNGSPIILFLGRLHPAKGIDTLFYAFRHVLSRQQATLVVVGQDNNGYRAILEELASDIGILPRVLFTGFLTGRDKLSALTDADVLVQPSLNEAGARPSLEAIMCGTPVVVTQDTGAGTIVSSFNGGLLFQSRNVTALDHTLQTILDKPQEALARTLKARDYIIDNLSLEKGIAGYEELYQEVV